MTDYGAVLTAEYPGTEWAIGDTYESLVWYSETAKPTKAALDKKWPKVQHDLEVARIAAERRARYQAETDGMFFAAQRDGAPLDDWKAAVDQIKTDLPYPEAP